MKKMFCFLAFTLLLTAPALAANEFGSPFANQAPAALGGTEPDMDMNAMAESLQDIMPAAGNEESTPGETTGESAEETGNTEAKSTTPEITDETSAPEIK